MSKVKVDYSPLGPEGKCWYVSDGGDMYIRYDLTEHSYLMDEGGTYFDTFGEAQNICDAYNAKGEKPMSDTQVRIEEGKYYKTARGQKVGPAHKSDGYYCWNVPWSTGSFYYNDSGEGCLNDSMDDIVAEWEEDTQVVPKFKVGDKVRVAGGPEAPVWTISEVNPKSVYCYTFEEGGAWEDEGLVLVTEGDTKSVTQTIQPGVTYMTVSKGRYTCIYTEGNLAWLKKYSDSTAYVWEIDTGEAVSLGEEWNLKREFATVE